MEYRESRATLLLEMNDATERGTGADILVVVERDTTFEFARRDFRQFERRLAAGG